MNSAGNINGVRNQFKQFLGGSEIPTEGLLGLGEEALNMGYYHEANACFGRVLEQYPQSKAAAFKQCLSQYLAGNTQAALSALKPSKKNSAQSNPQALALEALCHLSSGDLAAARETIAKLSSLNATIRFQLLPLAILLTKTATTKRHYRLSTVPPTKTKAFFPLN